MSSITKKTPLVDFLDPRKKPEWELLDLREETGHFEFELFSSVASEFNDIAGFQIEYYLLESKNADPLYGEDPLKNYDGPYRTKLLYEPTNEQSLIDMFGFSNDDTIQYAEIAKAVFERDITEQLNEEKDIEYDKDERQPIVGDVIKTLWDGRIYEISHVSSGEKIFHGKKLVWSFVLRPFRYSNESKSSSDLVFDDIEISDFPDVNSTLEPRTLKQQIKDDNIPLEEISDNIFDYSKDKTMTDESIDTSVYGFKKKKK